MNKLIPKKKPHLLHDHQLLFSVTFKLKLILLNFKISFNFAVAQAAQNYFTIQKLLEVMGKP